MSRRLVLALAGVAALVLLGFVVLPFLVDADRYRGLIETRAEKTLGREVSLGEIDLSFFPFGLRLEDAAIGALPEEGGGELLTARALAVGARFWPLLRKRLEITSIVLEAPEMVLARDREGNWNVTRLIAAEDAETGADADATDDEAGALTVESLRLVDGRITVRDAYLSPERPVEVTLADLDLELDAFGPASATSFVLTTRIDLGDGPGSGPLRLRGVVEPRGEGWGWDLELERTELAAAELASLGALLLGDSAPALAASEPVTIEATVKGASDEPSRIDARVALREATLRSPSLGAPLENLRADVVLAGETVRIEDLRFAIGESVLTGTLNVEGLETPRVDFELASEHADLGEILAALAAEEDATAADEPDATTELVARGTLRVAAGTWDTLAFEDLEAEARLEDGVLTLDPIAMRLYDGGFRGRTTVDLGTDPPEFALEGEASGVDVEPFLASSFDAAGLLSGRFTGKVEASGRGADADTLLRTLDGRGTARLSEGRIARLDVLRSVSDVAGVLGQRTLANLADRLATESTRFERLEASFRLAGGKMTFDELALESPDFLLEGQGLVDLLSAALDGRFRIAFSPELSELMRLESSRAAEVFWDAASERVAMPLGLRGSFDAPVANVDWGSAAERYAKRRLTSELGGLLSKALGGGGDDRENAEPRDEPPRGGSRASAGGLVAEITRARWGGSLLFQDLKLEGRASGAQRASLQVVDAGGRTLERIENLGEVDAGGGGDVAWRARVDGKDLVGARFPLTVTLTVFGPGGERVETELAVEK